MKIDNKISGAVFRVVQTTKGPAYLTPEEEVIEISLKSEKDSNSTNVYVLSKEAAKELAYQLVELTFSTLKPLILYDTRNQH